MLPPMRFAILAACSLLVMTGCVVQQGMTVTRTAHYDTGGKLTGYTVQETLVLPKVSRPYDDAVPVEYFETGNTSNRNEANWPPRRPAHSASHRRR